MRIKLREISEEEKKLHFSQDDSWVNAAIMRLDEESLEEPKISSRPQMAQSGSGKKPRLTTVDLKTKRVDNVYIIDGNVKSEVELNCSRCASAFRLPVSSKFSSLFSKDPVLAGIPTDKGPGSTQGVARQSSESMKSMSMGQIDSPDESEEEESDIDITLLKGDEIDLAQMITEQISLQIPMNPLCKPDCKGICPHCGTDWNKGRCACEKINRASPFSVLKDFSTKGSGGSNRH